jgi:hypothetical protein
MEKPRSIQSRDGRLPASTSKNEGEGVGTAAADTVTPGEGAGRSGSRAAKLFVVCILSLPLTAHDMRQSLIAMLLCSFDSAIRGGAGEGSPGEQSPGGRIMANDKTEMHPIGANAAQPLA